MAEKYTPETPMVKEIWVDGFAGFPVEPGSVDYVDGLAQFNRWYTRELEEAREEGRQEERARAKTEAPGHAFAVFIGPYELHHNFQEAENRLEYLVADGRYATVLKVALAPHTDDALGFSVREPTMVVAKSVEEI